MGGAEMLSILVIWWEVWMGADLCAGGYGFFDEDLALGEVVGHAGCGAELADCLCKGGLVL